MTLSKKMTRPGQEVEGEVELALTIRKVVQACPPEVPPSLIAPAIGLPSLIAPAIGIPALIPRISSEAQVHILNIAVPVTSPKVHPNLIIPVKGSKVHPNLIVPVKGPKVHPNLIALVKGPKVHPSLIIL